MSEIQTGKYAFLSESWRQFYNQLDIKTRRFVDYRGQGFTLANSWKNAGYLIKGSTDKAKETFAKTNASSYLKNHPEVAELIKMIQTNTRLKQLNDNNSALSQEILSNADKAKSALEIAREKTGEEATQLLFYVNIANGSTIVKETTTTTDAEGNKVVKVVEKEPSITDRIKAREKVDQILGIDSINKMVGQVELANGIQITVVDTSNKELLEDEKDIIDVEVENESEVESEVKNEND